MRRISAIIVALVMSSGFVFAAGIGPISVGDIDGAKLWLVENKNPPPVVKPKPAGAGAVTKGQKGKCICSTSAGPPPHTVCTGAC